MSRLFNSKIVIILFLIGTHELSLYAQDFTIPLRISDGVNSIELNFGVHSDGTDGYDAGLDRFAPPPPPGGSFDARFTINNEDYLTDIRGIVRDTVYFRLKYTAKNTRSISVHWDKEILNLFGEFEVFDPYTESYRLDMNSNDSINTTQSVLIQDALLIRYIRMPLKIKTNPEDSGAQAVELSNFPNPFNSMTQLQYVLEKKSTVCLTLFNMRGQEVFEIENGDRLPGAYNHRLNLCGFATGTYFVALRTDDHISILRIMHIK